MGRLLKAVSELIGAIIAIFYERLFRDISTIELPLFYFFLCFFLALGFLFFFTNKIFSVVVIFFNLRYAQRKNQILENNQIENSQIEQAQIEQAQNEQAQIEHDQIEIPD